MNTTSNNISGAAPAAVTGRTVPRNDDERAAAQFFADNPGAAVLAWPLYLARDKSPALEAPAAPAGWKLVPVQDTPSMWTAGGEAIKSCGGHERDAASLAYKAMLAAAPQAPAAPTPVAWPVARDVLQRWAQFADQAMRMQPRDMRNNMETLAEELTKLSALAPVAAPAAPEDPMDWPLPCDVTVGHGTIRKGCKLRTLVLRMQVLYDLSRKVELATPASESPAQVPHNLTKSEAVAELPEVCEAHRSSRAAQAAPASPAVDAGDPALPSWWPDFIQCVAELPDRNSPEDEPDAMIATAEELGSCALAAQAKEGGEAA